MLGNWGFVGTKKPKIPGHCGAGNPSPRGLSEDSGTSVFGPEVLVTFSPNQKVLDTSASSR